MSLIEDAQESKPADLSTDQISSLKTIADNTQIWADLVSQAKAVGLEQVDPDSELGQKLIAQAKLMNLNSTATSPYLKLSDEEIKARIDEDSARPNFLDAAPADISSGHVTPSTSLDSTITESLPPIKVSVTSALPVNQPTEKNLTATEILNSLTTQESEKLLALLESNLVLSKERADSLRGKRESDSIERLKSILVGKGLLTEEDLKRL